MTNAMTVTTSRSRVASAAAVLVLTSAIALPGCTQQQRDGLSSSYLIIDFLEAASGAEPTKFSGNLASDVLTNGSVFTDPGQVTLRLALKDPGGSSNPAQPTSTNYITVTRYHVKFVRSDGRNTQGVDVPYEFDGGVTGTVGTATTTLVFTLVRGQAKLETPLIGLANLGGAVFVSTIAQVTLYGTDQAGREVSVTGSISVNFADWADPDDAGDQ